MKEAGVTGKTPANHMNDVNSLTQYVINGQLSPSIYPMNWFHYWALGLL